MLLKALKNNQKDFPFAVLYKIENEGRNADIIAYAGINQDQTILPSHIDLLNPIEGTSNLCKAFNEKKIVISENKGRRKNFPKVPGK